MVLLLYMCVCQIKRSSGLSDIVSVGKGRKQNNLYIYVNIAQRELFIHPLVHRHHVLN